MQIKATGAVFLAEKIKLLEQQEADQTAALKLYAADMLKSLTPSSLLKNTVAQIAGSQTIRENIFDAALGTGAGLLAKKIYTGNSKNIFRKLTGLVLQHITSQLVSQKLPSFRNKINGIADR